MKTLLRSVHFKIDILPILTLVKFISIFHMSRISTIENYSMSEFKSY